MKPPLTKLELAFVKNAIELRIGDLSEQDEKKEIRVLRSALKKLST
jgi:hypothetical protein